MHGGQMSGATRNHVVETKGQQTRHFVIRNAQSWSFTPCSPEIDETELALDSLDTLGLIVADEIAETRVRS